MKFLLDFFHQEVPKSGKGMPAYYRRALFASELIVAIYFLMSMVVIGLVTGVWDWFPVALIVAAVACLYSIDKMSASGNLLACALLCVAWCGWYTHTLGWGTGSQHVMLPVFVLVFFNVFEPPWRKLLYFFLLILFRVLAFAYSLQHTPGVTLDLSSSIVLQVTNSLLPLFILALDYIIFSSSIQASERQLLINNQELHKEAGTDPLTQLLNRRSLLDIIEEYRANNPEEPFAVAIADIDFFKKVNDTYGHHCGDYTLKELSALFLASAEGKYRVCRWGGEEFCFFMPGLNLDEAGIQMNDLNYAVKKLPLHFNGVNFRITITIGVEEYDFQSPTEVLLDRADRKLYMGKVRGRDQVVV